MYIYIYADVYKSYVYTTVVTGDLGLIFLYNLYYFIYLLVSLLFNKNNQHQELYS